MAAPAIWISTLFIIGCLTLTHGQENAQTRIPDSLIGCYDNYTLRNPEYRPPMSIETFIDIVRKIEAYQGNSMDLTTLVISMIHRFRLDGIEKSDVAEATGIVPYAVKGFDFYKHRLILRYLVPGNNYQFPNESLSKTEQCTLHFMLSHSIDKVERGDESATCSKLSNYESGRSRIRRISRYRRQVDNLVVKTSTVPTTKPTTQEYDGNDSTEEKIDNQVENISQNSSEISEENLKHTTEDSLSQEAGTDEDKNDVEVIHNESDKNKTGKFIFDDSIPVEPKSRKVMLAPTSNPIDTHRPAPRNTVTTKESDCPVENGVVKTKWGSVALGTVVTGIAAGLFAQTLTVESLVLGGPRTKTLTKDLSTANIDNKFAATLTGDLAEVALNQGPRKLNDLTVGSVGGWNNSYYPRWYFDKQSEDNEMTDAEIRGGLDGLILATYVQKWKNSVPGGLKLSDLLTMYYSEDGVLGDAGYSACKRRDLYSGVAPNTVMQEQAYRFAAVLDQQSLTSASVEYTKIQEFATSAVNKLQNYLPGMTENSCSSTAKQPRSVNASSSTTYTNVTIVIDQGWDYSTIKSILFYFMKELNLQDKGSRITVLDGKKNAPFITDAKSTTDLDSNFTDTTYNLHDSGMDIPTAMEQELQRSMEGLLDLEKQNQIAGGRSTVILFIPKDTVNLNDNDLTIVKKRLEHFREYLPDVQILYLAPGNKDNYKYLVENPTTDVFTLQSTTITSQNDIPSMMDPVIERIKSVPLRLRNPTCGSDWKGSSYSNAEFTYSVKPQGVTYYRLHPNYFFNVGSFQVTVSPRSSSQLKVCYSRKSEFPDNATSDDTTCQQTSSGDVTIKISSPCSDFDYISQCPPLYISVTSLGSNSQNDCTDCLLPHYIKYSVRNQDLGCTAGVGRFLSNSHLITITAFIVLFWRNIKFSS